MILSIIFLLIATSVTWVFTLPKFKNKYIFNIISAAVLCVLTFLYWNNCILNTDFYKKINFYENMNPIDTYYSNTFHTTFLFYINSTVIEKPSNYSKETVSALINDDSEVESGNPDIIFIMMESYFDPNTLFDLNFTEPINENYKAISQKAVYGNMLSFKYGGGTRDIEFNVLNEINTTQYTESISYMNVFGNDYLPSFVHNLKDAGYKTYALHAYTSQLYNRINAYANMGFDCSKFVDEYSHTDKYGNYVSDISHAEEIIDTYEKLKSEGDEPVFIYGVSMQNHIYMSQNNIEFDRVYLTDDDYSDEFTQGIGVVGSYMRQTDNAIGKLYEYFENSSREVVIIIYGDHQSYNVENLDGFSVESLNEIQKYKDSSENEKYIYSHSTPFIMWSNKRDSEDAYYPLVSPHYLWSIACNRFNLESSGYEKFLFNSATVMPVDNNYAKIYYNNDYMPDCRDETTGNNVNLLNYDRLFGQGFSLE